MIYYQPYADKPTICIGKREMRVDITRWLVYRFSVEVNDGDWTTYGCIAGIFIIQTLINYKYLTQYHYECLLTYLICIKIYYQNMLHPKGF